MAKPDSKTRTQNLALRFGLSGELLRSAIQAQRGTNNIFGPRSLKEAAKQGQQSSVSSQEQGKKKSRLGFLTGE